MRSKFQNYAHNYAADKGQLCGDYAALCENYAVLSGRNAVQGGKNHSSGSRKFNNSPNWAVSAHCAACRLAPDFVVDPVQCMFVLAVATGTQ